MNRFRLSTVIIFSLAWAISGSAFAYNGNVENNIFEMESYTTIGGKTIPNVRVGWESWGALNEAKDNVILITHSFIRDAHAAGWDPISKTKGYWDAVIGSGSLIDTDKYFVISTDSLINMNANLPGVTTTGPATINPDTGKPYGMTFPLVTIRDMVNVQKALLNSLGITSLHAVMGVSMGASQAVEWASAYPEMVERIIPIVGAGETNSFLIGILDVWASPIMLDPKWNGGNYYASGAPMDGLREAFKLIIMYARQWKWADETFGRDWAEVDKNPATAFENQYKIQVELHDIAAGLAQYADANHFLYLAKAVQNFVAGHGNSLAEGLAAIKSAVLFIYSPDDLIIPADKVAEAGDLIEADGSPAEVEYVALQGSSGHADGTYSIMQAAGRITQFLERDLGKSPRGRVRNRRRY